MHFCATLFISAALWNVPSSGLQCLTCDNAKSPMECWRKGYYRECSFTETVCLTEVRHSSSWGTLPLIKTGCKEAQACNDNQIQNPRAAWGPTQCNDKKINSVCRCCCSGNRCNRRNLLCVSTSEPTENEAIRRRDDPVSGSLTEITCQVDPEIPERGQVSCTNGRSLESQCTFTCDEGYELVGSRMTTCVLFSKRAMWNRRSPTCREQVPKPQCDPVESPKFGGVNCSGSGAVGVTNCLFHCNNGLQLEGAEITSCIDTPLGPRWSENTPICTGQCGEVQSPVNGFVHCRGSGELGTTCGYLCNIGLELQGHTTTTCILTADGPQWTNDAPTCTGRCGRVETPVNGFVNCDGNREVGTVCSFTCHEGLRMIGASTTSCNMYSLGPLWTDAAPTCVGGCEQLPTPRNGFLECSGSSDLGATCAFDCEHGFEMEGDATTSCELMSEGPQWTSDVPICIAPVPPPNCPSLGQLHHGNIICTNEENSVGTTCSFECSAEGYVLLPSNRSETVCESTSDGEVRWSKKKPCCNANCPPMAKKDIVVIVDSSSSIRKPEWTRMIDFLVRLVRTFRISQDSVQISAFRFNRRVDKDTQILFGDYDTVDELTDAIRRMPKKGGGTFIGKALLHAQNVALTTRNRPNVTDMVFIMTDGKSKDEFRQTAKELRDSGVQIVALGVFREDPRGLVEQLVEMTGDRDLVLTATDVLNSFQDKLLKLIADKICEVSCE